MLEHEPAAWMTLHYSWRDTVHAFSQGARSRAAYTKPRVAPLARRRIGGRAALIAQIDKLVDEPLTDAERVTKICQLIHPAPRS